MISDTGNMLPNPVFYQTHCINSPVLLLSDLMLYGFICHFRG